MKLTFHVLLLTKHLPWAFSRVEHVLTLALVFLVQFLLGIVDQQKDLVICVQALTFFKKEACFVARATLHTKNRLITIAYPTTTTILYYLFQLLTLLSTPLQVFLVKGVFFTKDLALNESAEHLILDLLNLCLFAFLLHKVIQVNVI